MARAREMPPGLTKEQRYAWVQAQMEESARLPAGGRERADARLMEDAPPVLEPDVVDGVASWDVGHRDRPPHREGVEVGPQAPAAARRPPPGRAPEAPARGPSALDPDAARAVAEAGKWESPEEEVTRLALQPFGEDPDAPAPPGRTPFFVGDRATHAAPRGYGVARTPPRVEVAAGAPTITARTPEAPERGREGPRLERPSAPARRAGADASVRAATSDPFASVRALSPEVAEYLAGDAGRDADAPPQDDELLRAQGRGSRALLGAQLGRAGAMANEALTGTRVSDAWDGLEKQAGRPVGDLLQRREDAQRQGRDARDMQRFTREEDLYRADSQRSANARAQALLRFGTEVSRIPDEKFRSMSAADVADFVKGLEKDRDDTGTAQRHRESMAAQAAGRRDAREERELRMELMREERQARADEKAAAVRKRQDERDLQVLEKRMSGVNEVSEDIATLNSAIAQGGDIPGFGVWDSWKMNDPGFLAKVARTVFADEDDHRVSMAARRLSGNENRAMTGLASSDQERAENMRRRGLDSGNTEEAAVQGVQTLARDTLTKHRNVEAGFRDPERPEGELDVLEQYRRNGGMTSANVPEPVYQPRTAINPKTREKLSVDSLAEEQAFRGQGWIIR
jgi:hypothetical protein